MFKGLVYNFIGVCAKRTFNFSLIRGCYFIFFQEEIPKEAYLEAKKEK
ncbi:MAG: hypothetical protein ACK5LC_02005 [Coprobacillaceae bacterium]